MHGCRFYRQKVIGGYIVDFYCPRTRMVLEVDGNQHQSEEAAPPDRVRDEYMSTLGLRTLRFTNYEVLHNIEAVVGRILEKMTG